MGLPTLALCGGGSEPPVGSNEAPPEPVPAFVEFLFEYLEAAHSDQSFDDLIYISIKSQTLYVICDGSITNEFPISSGVSGVGNKKGSGGTPIGLHSVYRKIGDDVPTGGIFWHASYTGRVMDSTYTKNNAVTSRIIWLTGEEPGINKGGNCDTADRFIYIHGTSGEEFIGEPASRGCIRMRNEDVVFVYGQVEVGTPIVIANN